MVVIVGIRVAANVEAEGGNEEARMAMLCGVVTLILRSSPRANRTACKFCIAWTKAFGLSWLSSVVKYSLPTAMATMEVAGMKGTTREENHSSAADVSELMLATCWFSTATMRSIPVLEKASRISGLES
ncbi:hypothetical protein O6P43_016378 [Quillaja saponaria]|uniref:Uncharacterized protein n=1 Tax=Quillaja saponaria TaxID=32244 RepID=A0AAD7PTL1_QUISA|nr:hypothetical protein O6P43_016378 [Quillaja saponaria]